MPHTSVYSQEDSKQWGKDHRKSAEHTHTPETETGCNTTGDRQGAEAVRRRDACWGLWCPVREGLLLKGEEARSDTELVLLPPSRLHPVNRTFLTDRALIFNPEKKRNHSPRQTHKYTALEMNRKMENKFNWSPVKLKH